MTDYFTPPDPDELDELEREDYWLEDAKERFEADFQARNANNPEPEYPITGPAQRRRQPTPTSRSPIPPPALPLYAAARKRKLKKDP